MTALKGTFLQVTVPWQNDIGITTATNDNRAGGAKHFVPNAAAVSLPCLSSDR